MLNLSVNTLGEILSSTVDQSKEVRYRVCILDSLIDSLTDTCKYCWIVWHNIIGDKEHYFRWIIQLRANPTF